MHWLKPYNISMQQFNVLRILRGARPEPLTVTHLMERMLDKASNASRLVDKLNQKKLVAKIIPEKDQRIINVFITNEGLDVLEKASKSVEEGMNEVFMSLSDGEAAQLSDLLDKLRG